MFLLTLKVIIVLIALASCVGWQFWVRGCGIGIELEKFNYEHQTLVAQYQIQGHDYGPL